MRSEILMVAFIAAILPGMGGEHDSVQSNLSEVQLSGSKTYFIQGKTKYKYVGARGCVGRCHNSEESGYQYMKWEKSRHSGSYFTLSTDKAMVYAKKAGIKEIPQKSLTCLRCHITGAEFDSTSFGSTYQMEEGVTCEACHKSEFVTYTSWKGKPGVVNTKDLQPDENTCLRCHNDQVHKIRRFSYEAMHQKIAHARSVR